MPKGKGFFVSRGSMVRLKNGQEVDVLDWLQSEKIQTGMCICNFNLQHSQATSDWPERMHFFNATTVTEAPF